MAHSVDACKLNRLAQFPIPIAVSYVETKSCLFDILNLIHWNLFEI
ncbi:hypothetical protein D1AOALGA4SA_2856 [Olavius algarvensis Delta 1 endosymbiont]|nr:hypothetical protein D1AOALGA4SA_2856 [Olavius algarvensis Delta 1 endosymbiont]